jgi:MFS transporter, FLVCR family, MFS-domain-containing protein 7
MSSIKYLMMLPEFYMTLIPFVVYVALFNSISSVINQILFPYGFSETEAGIAGALLIVVGLIASAIASPIIDRSKKFLLAIKIVVPIIAICYLAFIWAPPTRTDAAVYSILAILGAASFSLVPVVLEYLCEITHPVSPEVTSTICWSGGQLLGGIFIQIANALTDGPNGGGGGDVPYNMQRNLWFQAGFAIAVVPLPLSMGLFGRGNKVRLRRVEADKANSATGVVTDNMANDTAVAP